MKATLEFDLTEEEALFHNSLNGPCYLVALESLAREFRDRAKHCDPPETTWQEAKDLFWDTLKAEGLELP